MRYSVCKRNGKPQLVRWSYNWPSDSFSYNYGTVSHWDNSKGDLPFKILADITFGTEKPAGFLRSATYPKNNWLKVKSRTETLLIKDVRKLRGFKSFFGGKNITIIHYENTPEKMRV